MHSKSEADQADGVTKDSLNNRYQNNLESMKGNKSASDYVYLMYFKCHKINPNRGGSYVDSLYWIKIKKRQLIPSIKKITCFQYAVTVMLNYEEIQKHGEKIRKIKLFINKYKW